MTPPKITNKNELDDEKYADLTPDKVSEFTKKYRSKLMSKLAKQENARKEEAKKEQQRLDAAQKKIEEENEANIAINKSTQWCSC